ncbi:MAG: dTDP-4-dehydrorhamnose reductase [Stenotrophobium sp.]
MTILITGANGQVGRELTRHAGTQAVALTRQQLDISRSDAVHAELQRIRPQVVINAAAYTAVDKAEKEPDAATAINRDGPAHLASACRQLHIPLLHISTDYVFDGKKPTPYLESDPATPVGIYAVSKWEGEQRVRAELSEHIILRVSWVFGAHGGNFVKTILRLARERPELRVVADQKGCPTHAGAIAEALLSLAKRVMQGERLPWGTCHYTGTPATTWHGFASGIVEQAAELGLIAAMPIIHPITTAEYPLPAPRPANSILDCTNAVKALGLTQQDWRQGLREVLTTLKQQNA